METREISAILTSIFILGGSFWYAILVMRGEIKPVLASWIVLASTLSLSLVTYMTTKEFNWASSTMNGTSAFSALFVLVAIRLKVEGGITFSLFQKRSLMASGVILALWIVLVWGFGKSGNVPNLLTQILMVIGYALTAQKLWGATTNTDSSVMWWAITLAGFTGLYTAINSGDRGDGLAIIYSVRSLICSSFILFLIWRIGKKQTK